MSIFACHLHVAGRFTDMNELYSAMTFLLRKLSEHRNEAICQDRKFSPTGEELPVFGGGGGFPGLQYEPREAPWSSG